MAKVLSESDQAEAIARRHIREMKTEFAQLNKVRKKKATKTNVNSNVSHQTAIPNVQQQTPAPNVQQQTPAPSVQQQTTSPNVQQQTPAPKVQRATSSAPNVRRAPTAGPQPEAGYVVAPNREEFVVLNPPRSNTKGRKKGRIPSGIELQTKKKHSMYCVQSAWP